MKKILSLMVAALSLLALSSCMKENFSNGADEATMTLNISMPDAVATKAYGDGMFAAKNVIIGVFDEKGVEKFRKNFVWEKDVFQQEVTIQFVMGKTYQMVLWAQYGDAYGDPKSMPLDEITLDYKQSNREDLDAFYAYVEPFRVTKDFSKSITLKRPFAQLNFATTVGDMDESIAAGDLGIHNKAQVTVKNLANTLDLFTGKTSYVAADGTETESGAAVIIPETEFPKVDGKYPTIKVEETVYEVVSMNYVLVADAGAQDGKTTVDLTFKVGELEINVPTASMKRNWRTNVVGELLTGEGTFTVKIDQNFDGAYNENWNEGTGNENPEQPEVEYSEWKLLGSHNEWATEEYMVLEDGLAVARNVEFPATKAEGDGEFKVSNGTDWYGMPVSATVGTDKYLAASKDNSANIFVAPGKYDIWFDAAKTTIYVMTPGKAIAEATEFKAPQPEEPETDTWGIVGNMTDWGTKADIAMTKKTVAEVEYWFADNFTVAATDEFKFRLNSTWGTELTAGAVTPDKECAVAAGAGNIKMAAGTYDVYLDVANSKLFMMTGDKTPADAGKVEMTDVEFYAVKADWNNNTLYAWGAITGISWPGKTTQETVTINAVDYYKWTLSVPVDAIGKDVHVIFNDGKADGALQTVDSPAFKLAEKQYFKTGELNAGKYALEQIEAPVVEEPEQPEPIVPAVALTLVSTEAVPAEGGNVVVKVTSNVAWTLALDGTKVTEGAEAVTDFEVTVPVAANTATEVANHTLLLSDVPAEGAQTVTATAEFTQAAAQPEEPETPETITVAEFLAAEVDENVYYRLKGTITSVANTTYGNFNLTDDTGTVYIYGLVSEDGATNKYWDTSGAKLGDDIVISVPRAEFNNAPQGKNARFIELISPGTYAFYTLGTEAVDFTSAGGEQVVAVDVYNTSAAVTASSDNAKFTVSVNGKNITISSTANELEEKVQGNVTVQVGNLAAKTIKVTLAAKPASGVVEGGQDDFHTISTNTSYLSGKTTAGWEYKNCAIFKGGSSDSSPAFKMIGEESNRALCMNGKTSAVGTITSPKLTTGCGTLKFNYGLPFSDTMIKFRVDIIQNDETVHTFTVDKASPTKLEMYSHEEVVNVAGDFQIVFTNLSPSNSSSNKDRTAIWDVEWTGCAK